MYTTEIGARVGRNIIPVAHHDAHTMHTAVVDKGNRFGIDSQAIQLGAGNALTPALRVGDNDLVLRAEEAPDDLVLGQDDGMQGVMLNTLPRRRSPRMLSRPARYIQPAEPVYQLHPPRPACGGRA